MQTAHQAGNQYGNAQSNHQEAPLSDIPMRS